MVELSLEEKHKANQRLMAAIFCLNLSPDSLFCHPWIMEGEEKLELSTVIQDALKSLPVIKAAEAKTPDDRLKKVIELRFGLEDGKPKSLEEVAREFGVTKERIRHIQDKALRILRHPSLSKRLKRFLVPMAEEKASL